MTDEQAACPYCHPAPNGPAYEPQLPLIDQENDAVWIDPLNHKLRLGSFHEGETSIIVCPMCGRDLRGDNNARN